MRTHRESVLLARPLALLLVALLIWALPGARPARAQSVPEGAIELASSSAGYVGAVEVSGGIAYLGEGAGLTLLDVSDSARPQAIGRLSLRSVVTSVAVDGTLVYLGTRGGLAIVDAGNPRQPRLAASYSLGEVDQRVLVQGRHAYILYRSEGLQVAYGLAVVSLADPARPRLLSDLRLPGEVLDMALAPDAALLLVRHNWPTFLVSVDLRDPAAPAIAERLPFEQPYPARVLVSAGRAFLADYRTIRIYDLSSPTSPAYLGQITLPEFALSNPADLLVHDGLLYLGTGMDLTMDGLVYVFEMSNPAAPSLRDTYRIPDGVTDLAIQGDRLYVSSAGEGLLIFSTQPGLALMGHYRSLGQGGRGAQVYLDGARGFVRPMTGPLGGAQIALLDLSDPASPRVRSMIAVYSSIILDLAVQGPYLVVATDDTLEVWDITSLDQPLRLGDYKISNEIPYIQQLQLDGGYAYLRLSSSIEIVDYRDPSGPARVARYVPSRTPQALHVAGERAYLLNQDWRSFEGDLQVLDLSNPRAPALLSQLELGVQPGRADNAQLKHQGDYLVAGLRYREGIGDVMWTGELVLIDISQRDRPRLRDSRRTDQPFSQLWVTPGTLYLSLDGTELQVWDFSQPEKLRLLGSYRPGGVIESLVPQAAGGAALLVQRPSHNALELLDHSQGVRVIAHYALGSGWYVGLAGAQGLLYTTGESVVQSWRVAPERLAPDLTQCFPETRLCMADPLLGYWRANGGLPVFGLPIQPAREEMSLDLGRPLLAQWLERNRLELHPENLPPYQVQLGRLGAELLKRRGVAWQGLPRAAGPQPGCLWFAETQHNVCDQAPEAGFKRYWQSHGLEFDRQPGTSYAESLALFGLPLSEPAMETNSSGDTVLTQWFERARFEWHPGNPEPYKVLLGRLGAELLK